MTLGAGHGKVVLGSPLDLSFTVTADEARHLEDSCLSAQVRMGDTLVADRQTSVGLVSPQSILPRVRVRTSVPVNEPVVEVRLQATCGGNVSRVYTFLSSLPGVGALDVPRTSAEPAERGVGGQAPRREPARSAGSGRAGEHENGAGRSTGVVQRGKNQARPVSRARPSAPPGRPQSLSRPQEQALPVAADLPRASAPRLVMEPLDVWLEAPPDLRLSIDPPQFGEPEAAQSHSKEAAEVWKVLNTPPLELARLGTRVDEATKETQAAKKQLAGEQAQRLELERQLRELASERFSAWVVYGLSGLLAAALLLLAWQAWLRRRQDEAAWRQSVELHGEELSVDDLSESTEPTAWPQAQTAAESAVEPLAPGPETRPPAVLFAEADRELAMTPQDPPSAFESTLPPALRVQEIEHPEELFDVLQQAEFFISIGEHEQAVGSLRRHIAQHPASSPLAYLELLRLYHTLGRVSAFDELSAGFADRFNAQVPPFATFQRGGRSLEDYGEELGRIESLWGSPQVLDELDRLMLHREGAQGLARFDLPAYEDLLLLLAIARSSSGKGRGASSSAAPRAAVVVTSSIKGGGRSVDTLAGDLVLEPSQPVPIHGTSAGTSAADATASPQIVAPDPVPDPDEIRFSLAPRDSGGRIIK